MKRQFFLLLCVIAAAISGCRDSSFVTDQDPGGCRLERIAVEEGISRYHCNGVSPDGRSVAIGWDVEQRERGAYLLDLETGKRTDLPQLNNCASYTPDGKMLVAAIYEETGKTDIAELNLETRELQIIAQHEQWDWLPSYSPDGKWILFNSYRTGNSDIYLYERASTELRQLTSNENYEAHATFSPDGKRIVFHRQVGDADFNIVIMDVATGSETQITDSPREESYPSWTPDGKHILFSSDEGNEPGKPNIAVMTDEGEFVSRLTGHPAKDAYAFSSPDGKYVYFNSYRDPEGLYRLKVDANFGCE